MTNEKLRDFERWPAGAPMDETDVSLRAYLSRLPDDHLARYSAGWTDDQVIEWVGNFRADGHLMLVCCERDVEVYIEQPCLTYEECLAVRRHTDHPFVLDENIDSLGMLLRGKADLAMDVVNLKISKLGGLTRTKQARDLASRWGLP